MKSLLNHLNTFFEICGQYILPRGPVQQLAALKVHLAYMAMFTGAYLSVGSYMAAILHFALTLLITLGILYAKESAEEKIASETRLQEALFQENARIAAIHKRPFPEEEGFFKEAPTIIYAKKGGLTEKQKDQIRTALPPPIQSDPIGYYSEGQSRFSSDT